MTGRLGAPNAGRLDTTAFLKSSGPVHAIAAEAFFKNAHQLGLLPEGLRLGDSLSPQTTYNLVLGDGFGLSEPLVDAAVPVQVALSDSLTLAGTADGPVGHGTDIVDLWTGKVVFRALAPVAPADYASADAAYAAWASALGVSPVDSLWSIDPAYTNNLFLNPGFQPIDGASSGVSNPVVVLHGSGIGFYAVQPGATFGTTYATLTGGGTSFGPLEQPTTLPGLLFLADLDSNNDAQTYAFTGQRVASGGGGTLIGIFTRATWQNGSPGYPLRLAFRVRPGYLELVATVDPAAIPPGASARLGYLQVDPTSNTVADGKVLASGFSGTVQLRSVDLADWRPVVAEAARLGDSPAGEWHLGASLSQRLNLLDAPRIGYAGLLAEALGLVEGPLQPDFRPGAVLADQLSVRSVLLAGQQLGLALADAAALRDALRAAATPVLADALGLGATPAAAYGQRLRELVALAEGLGPATAFGLTVAEQAHLIDLLRSGLPLTLGETVGATDTLAASRASTLVELLALGEALSGEAHLGLTVAERARLNETLRPARGTALADSMALAELLTALPALAILERVALGDTPGLSAIQGLSVDERLRLREALRSGRAGALAEAIGVGELLGASLGRVLLDALGLTEAVLPTTSRGLTVSDRLGLLDRLARFLAAGVDDAAALADSPTLVYRPLAALGDALALGDDSGGSLLLGFVLADDMALVGTASPAQVLGVALQEGLRLRALYVAPSGSTTAWAVNTETGFVSEYTNFTFQSFAPGFGDHFLGASPSGLYTLDGSTDAGSSIIARLRSGYAQFGGAHLTQFKGAYLGMRGGGDVILRLITADGKQTNYRVTTEPMRTTKVHLGKGLRARYWSFELETVGQDFDLESIEFIPLLAQRRV